LGVLPIISERLVAAVPAGHPLLSHPRVTLDQVSCYPIVCLPEGTGIRTVLDQACAAKGIRPVIALQASAPSSVTDLATRGLGVAVLSQSMIAQHGDQLQARLIDDLETPAVLALVWTRADSPALRQLLVHARRAFTRP
jgi:DNA-binding transcriptional LysR family regulator